MVFTCCSNFMFYEQFKVDIHFANFGQVKIDPIHSLLLLWTGRSYFTEFGQEIPQNNPNSLGLTKKSRTTHRIWHKSFSMIQSARTKNWLPQSINRLQRFSFLFLFVTLFSDFCNKIICMTQDLLNGYFF